MTTSSATRALAVTDTVTVFAGPAVLAPRTMAFLPYQMPYPVVDDQSVPDQSVTDIVGSARRSCTGERPTREASPRAVGSSNASRKPTCTW